MSTDPTTPAPVHIVVLLDRSGSMSSIAGDVIGGFNAFLADQQRDGPDARITLFQFDSREPLEVIADAIPIAEAVSLTADTFQPRGGTPLLDATGLAIGRIRAALSDRARQGSTGSDVVFVSITDGHENQSREYTLGQVRSLIADCEKEGWVFVFLSAALDAYADAERMGLKQGNIQSFDADGVGSQMAFASMSANMRSLRDKKRSGAFADEDFFEDGKPAERRRKGT